MCTTDKDGLYYKREVTINIATETIESNSKAKKSQQSETIIGVFSRTLKHTPMPSLMADKLRAIPISILPVVNKDIAIIR
jgi:hypothetical protein